MDRRGSKSRNQSKNKSESMGKIQNRNRKKLHEGGGSKAMEELTVTENKTKNKQDTNIVKKSWTCQKGEAGIFVQGFGTFALLVQTYSIDMALHHQ